MKVSSFGEYIVVYIPEHPNANTCGYLLEHRYVMEQHLGRYLTKDEVVHHINGNKSDNRIENLQVMTNSEHIKLHWSKEHILQPCPICGILTENKYCSQKCSHINQRKVKWPTKEELKVLINIYSKTKIGKIYGVSDNAVRKWIKYYNIK